MSATIPLTTFARNPRKALRRLPADGLVLTRPGEAPLRITLDPVRTSAQPGQTEEAGTTVGVVPTPEAEAVTAADAPVRDATDDLARAALMQVSMPQLIQLVRDRNPWLEELPPAARRMALGEIEAARAESGDAEGLALNLSAALEAWHTRALPFSG